MGKPESGRAGGPGATPFRWECSCRQPPVLLGTFDAEGRINLKVRDRYWRVLDGVVETLCPRCGSAHALGPLAPLGTDAAPPAERTPDCGVG
ncbi:MAG: hypothetical protein IT337_14920 [Thermomicrobiales bacterium]|nr:hypothetical protein [Thermomicrobiales bacterium]